MSDTKITGDQLSSTFKIPGTKVDSDFGSQDVKTSGFIWSTTSGIKFPDNTVQTTAGGGGGDATSLQGEAISASTPSGGDALIYNGGTNEWTPTPVTASAAGSTGYVQYNTAGSLAADADFYWDSSNKWMGLNLSGTSVTTPSRVIDANGIIRTRLANDSGGQGGYTWGTPNSSSDNFALRMTTDGLSLNFDYYNGSWLQAMTVRNTGWVGIGTTSASTSALFQVNSTTKGFLAPRMTTTERNAIASPDDGLWVYDLTLHQYFYWDGNASAWVAVNAATLSGSGAAGRMAFWTGATSLSSNAGLTWDDTNLVMALGSTPASFPSSVPALFVSGDSAPAVLGAATYGSVESVIFMMHAGGSFASPSATPNNSIIGSVGAVGHDGTDFDYSVFGGSLKFRSTEVWSGSAHGTKFELALCSNGGTTESTMLSLINDSGTAKLGVGFSGTPTFPLDVVGDVNTSTRFSIGGVPGITAGIVVSPTQSLSLTVVGGIITAYSVT